VPVWELEDIHTSCQNILLIFIRNLLLSILYTALSSEIVFFGFAALYCTSFWLRCLCLLFDVRLSHLINITYIHTRSDTQTTIALPLIKTLSDRSAGMISRSFQETLWPQFIRICTVFASVLMKKLILPDRVANPQYHTDPDLLQDVFYWQLEFSFTLSRRLSPYHMHGIAHTHTHTHTRTPV